MQSINARQMQISVLSGLTPKKVVDAPTDPLGVAQVIGLDLSNVDTDPVTATLMVDVSGVQSVLEVMPAIPAGGNYDWRISLDKRRHLGPTQSLYIKLAGAPTLNQPIVTATVNDCVNDA